MPRYISKKEVEKICKTEKIDKLVITPHPWYRSLPILKNMLTYRVGDRVEFHIHIELPKEEVTFLRGEKDKLVEIIPPGKNPERVSVYEKHPNKDKFPLAAYYDQDIDVEGDIMTSEGDVEYGIAVGPYHPILTTKVTSSDTTWSRLLWLLIGAAITFICTIIYGLIKVFPAWEIWWPWR